MNNYDPDQIDRAVRNAQASQPRSPLLWMRRIIYLAIGAMLVVALSYKLSPPEQQQAEQLAIPPELREIDRIAAEVNSPEDALRMAEEFMNLDRHPEALALLERANALLPNDAEQRYWLGIAKTQMGNYTGAETDLQRSLKLSEDPKTRLALGLLYRNHLHQPEKAKAELGRLIADPDAPPELREQATRLLDE